jgi:hypothetical protein
VQGQQRRRAALEEVEEGVGAAEVEVDQVGLELLLGAPCLAPQVGDLAQVARRQRGGEREAANWDVRRRPVGANRRFVAGDHQELVAALAQRRQQLAGERLDAADIGREARCAVDDPHRSASRSLIVAAAASGRSPTSRR